MNPEKSSSQSLNMQLKLRVEKLEQKIDQIMAHIEKQSPLSNSVAVPEYPFERLATQISLQIRKEDVEYLLNANTVTDTMARIFRRSLSELPARTLPIRVYESFGRSTKGANQIIVYRLSTNQWTCATRDDFVELFEAVSRNLHMEFVRYKRSRENEIANNEALTVAVDGASIKLMNISFIRGKTTSVLISEIYAALSLVK